MGQEADSLTLARQDSLAITESDDFVKASILVATPSNVLYSCAGHTGIRMQCPHYGLDVVYTYESEAVTEKVLTFLMGNLKMGMTSVPAQRVLSDYANAGRGISEYVLNIPLDKRKQLWQYLDRKVEEGMNLPYDFLYRGCAITSLRAIQAALLPDTISFGKWDEKFVKKSRRVLVSNQVIKYPWQHFFLQTMVGTEVEQPCAITSKVIIPQDLIDVLQKATLNGQPLLEQPQILATVEFSADQCAWFPTPKMLAFLLLMLAFVSCCYMQRSLSYLFLLLQSLFGIFMIYLVVFSNLPCTNFSWLLIPFNPLPLLFWYWRKLWLLPFGVICSVWSLVMFLQMGNTLVDLAHIVFALALAVNCISQWIYIRKLK
jgi:hypothetical protein